MAQEMAYVITGPTSGIGRRTAVELAAHGTVVLVGRDPGRLSQVRQEIERGGGKAVTVVCDLSDIAAVRRAAAEIAEMVERARADGPLRDAPMEFVSALMNSLAEATMDFMVSDPAHAEEHSRAGFGALCRILGD